MEITFWGVRGSIPTPGSDTQRWGGNSSCVEVRHPGQPPLVLDCGTGARALGFKLLGEPGRRLHLLFTHFHMDHLFGFPFFVPIYTPGYEIQAHVPAYTEAEARDRLGRFLNGVYHPTRLRDVPAQLSFHPIRPFREFRCGGYRVMGISLNHPGGSVGYRIDCEGESMAYITDTAPFAKPGEGVAAGLTPTAFEARVIDALRNVDFVIFDTMYSLDEYLEKMTWGHSYPEYAHALCRAAGVRKLCLFHHLPDASDEMLDRLQEHWSSASEPTVCVASEQEMFSVKEVSVNIEG